MQIVTKNQHVLMPSVTLPTRPGDQHGRTDDLSSSSNVPTVLTIPYGLWPAKSPDSNPIEHCESFKCSMKIRSGQFASHSMSCNEGAWYVETWERMNILLSSVSIVRECQRKDVWPQIVSQYNLIVQLSQQHFNKNFIPSNAPILTPGIPM